MSTESPLAPIFEVGVVTFSNAEAADRVVDGLRQRGATHLVNQVATLEHHPSGRFSVHSYTDESSRAEHVGVGIMVGGLVGLLFGPFGMLVGLVGGGAVGASLPGQSSHDLGLDDTFVERLKTSLPPDSSAVLILGEPSTVDELVGEIHATDMVTANEFRQPLSEAQAESVRKAIEANKGATT
jgi:uncharacterized membrane protein